MNEPRYVDDGDEFEDEDNSWRYTNDLENRDIIHDCMMICGKWSTVKHFKDRKESRMWHLIDKKLSKGVMPFEWVRSCMDWAAKKNKNATQIRLDVLGKFILNKEKMTEWMQARRNKYREWLE